MIKTIDIPTEQLKRKKSAEEAFAKGRWQYWREGDSWKVKTTTDTYTILSSKDECLNCSCPDHQHYAGQGLECKHICGLRLNLLAQGAQTDFTEGVSTMTDTPVTQLIERLNQPLDPARVKWREASKREQVPYLEGYDVINTANELFAYRWSFETGEPQVRQWQRTRTRWDKNTQARVPQLGKDGQPLVEQVGIVWITGRVTVYLDGQAYIHADVGRCNFTGDAPEALDTAISGCATDCLKRCFRQLGGQFGNDLYDKGSRAGLTRSKGKQSEKKQPAAEAIDLTLEQARAVPCPLGSKSHPEYKGLVLEQVAQAEDGLKVLQFLAGDQYHPNGDRNGRKSKVAARLLLDALQPGGVVPPERHPAGTKPAGQPAE